MSWWNIKTDINNNRVYPNHWGDNFEHLSGALPRGKIAIPTGFLWDPMLNIYETGIGRFECDFDFGKRAIYGAGKTYYVDCTNGNDSNSGLTSALALKSIKTAIQKNDVDIILLAPGVYTRDIGWQGTSPARSITVKPLMGRVIISNHIALTWSATVGQTNVYQVAEANAGDVYDRKYTDAYGDSQKLVKVGSIAEVNSTPGSWFTDATTVYVKTTDSRNPDSSVRVYSTAVNGYITSVSIYIEDLEFEGGVAPFRAEKTTGQTAPILYAKNCWFKYSSENGLSIKGASYVYLQNCIAAKNYQDGFNYHLRDGVISNAMEVNCVGRNNGEAPDGGISVDNGSTMHDGGKIIRINGKYFENKGPNIADINTNTQSWNLGCLCYESLADAGAYQNSNFNVGMDSPNNGGEMWLDNCKSYGSTYDIVAGSQGTARVKNLVTNEESNNHVTGSIVEY